MFWDDDAPLAELAASEDAEELCRRLLASPRAWGSSTRHTEAVELLVKVHGTSELPMSFVALMLCTNSRRSTISRAPLEAMVEEATVDCYNEEEQATGLFTMIEENLTVPFETRVLGVSVTVTDVALTDSIQIVATCRRDGLRQAIPILDLPLPTPPPAGTDWIEAYRRWLG